MERRAFVRRFVLVPVLAIGRATWARQSGGSSSPNQKTLRITPAEIELYQRAKTLIDWTEQQIASSPVLHHLRPAESQDILPTILERVGKNTLAQAKDFPRIACDEEVFSQSTMKDDLVPHGGIHSNDSIHDFRYFIIPRSVGEIPTFEEYRTDVAGRPVDLEKMAGVGMFSTNFTESWMYFNPSIQPTSRFRYFGTQAAQKRECYVIGFAQRPEAAGVITSFRMVEPAAAVLVQGFVWVDQKSFEIVKIETGLLAPRTDIQLDVVDTIVNYSPVQPAGFNRVLWVPHDITVTVILRGVFFQDKHHYSNFKFFRAESAIKPAS